MKKILLSALTLLTVVGIVTTATFAYFSDIETSNTNNLSMGTLDLKVDNQDDPNVIHITRTNLKPYPAWSHSYGGQWVLKNAGSVQGRFSMKITNIKNYENSCNNPETDDGDVTCGVGTDQGELGDLMFAKWSRNEAPWGGWGTKMSPLNSAADVIVVGDILNPGETRNAYLDLEWDTHLTGDNLGQTDSIEFDIVFYFDQV